MSTHKLKRQILKTLKVPDNYLSRKELMPDVPKYEAMKAINELISEGLVEVTFEGIDDNPTIELTDRGYYVLNNHEKHIVNTYIKRVTSFLAPVWKEIIVGVVLGLLTLLLNLLKK